MNGLAKLAVRQGLVAACCILWQAARGSGLPEDLRAIEQRPQDALLAGQIVARVVIFVSNDCPIANRYAPEFRRLHKRFAPRGVAFWLVHSDPDETLAQIRDHDRQYNLNLPTLRDPRQELARFAQAQVVPSAAVFGAQGELVYRGRIDDRFAEIGRERPRATRHDLEDALEAVVAHRPVKVRETQAVGCYIPESH